MIALIVLFTALALTQTGCGVFFGNVKPVEEKAKGVAVLDLAKQSPQTWSRLDDPEFGDTAFHSAALAATISLVTACSERAPAAESLSTEARGLRLEKLASELARGMTDVTLRRSRPVVVSGRPALESTLVGKMPLGVPTENTIGPIVLQSVVLQSKQCSYELISVAIADKFEHVRSDFARFVQSLELPENR